jgi:hypothetical protein
MFKIPNPLPVVVESTASDEKRYGQEKDDRSAQIRAAQHLNGITVAAAAISLLALGALFVSLGYTRTATIAATKQADTAQREFVSSQRPWLSTKYMVDALLEIGPDSPTLQVGIQITNVGHSIAKNVIFHPILVANRKETGRECESISDEVHKKAVDFHAGIVAFPNESINLVRFASKDNPQMQEAYRHPISPGKIMLQLIGCVTYNSSVDEDPHYTKYIFDVMPKGSTVQNDFDFTSPSVQHVDLMMDANQIEAN